MPEVGDSVELTAFDPDGPLEDPIRWQAKVVQMDGRRIDLLELVELGRRGDTDSADTNTNGAAPEEDR